MFCIALSSAKSFDQNREHMLAENWNEKIRLLATKGIRGLSKIKQNINNI